LSTFNPAFVYSLEMRARMRHIPPPTIGVRITYTKLFIRTTAPHLSFYPKFKAQNDGETGYAVRYMRECFLHVNNVIIRFKPPLL